MQRICVVEDEKSIGSILQMNLELEGYEVELIDDGAVAQSIFELDFNFELIILDVMLPHVNGIDLCKIIRKKSAVPVLFLSAKGATSDRIEGLKAGGNDYLPKPFDLEEMLLRVAALIPSDKKGIKDTVIIGNKTVDFKSFDVKDTVNGNTIQLSKKEIALIQLFIKKEGEVISRTEILDEIWGENHFPTTRTIDNYILNFRKIFEEEPKNPQFFHSVRGVGYKFTL